jgi:hypothetical protein
MILDFIKRFLEALALLALLCSGWILEVILEII